MELTVQEESAQPVFSRRRLQLEITFEHAVPARGVLATKLAASQDVPLETVAVRKIRSRFGGGTAQAEAFIYESAEALEKFEQKHLVQRTSKTLEQEPEPAEEAPVKASEEAPAAEEPAAEESQAEEAEETPAQADESSDDSEDSEKKE